MSRCAGEFIGPFEILQLLGAGGCGEVYKARRSDGAIVALKVLTSSSPFTIAHFERELRATPDHPNIRKVHRDGEGPDGTRWLEMDYLDGDSLRDRLNRRRLSWSEVLSLGTQTCAALQAAHERGVIHRDLKPENLFVGVGDAMDVRVVDFSIALLQDAERLTLTGTILGTFQYMSPEQVRGEFGLDARSDLWSLGVVLYECVAGRCPFQASTLAGLVYNVAFQTPAPVSRHSPDVPPRLAEVIHRALNKNPSERFQTALAFREALASVRGHGVDALAPTIQGSAAVNGIAGVQAEDRALMSLVFLRGVVDAPRVSALAAEYGGELVPFADHRAIARFGGTSLRGDEPERAVRLASAALPHAEGIGVATGWTLTPERVEGSDLASRAERLASNACVTMDIATAGAVRDQLGLTEHPDGSAALTSEQAAALTSGLSSAGAEFSARSTSTTGFFGREALTTALLECVSATAHAGVTAVVVQGEAGVGKSRLMQEALLRVRSEDPVATLLACRCTSYRKDIPLGAWQELLSTSLVEVDLLALSRHATLAPEVFFDQVTATVEPIMRELAQRGPVVIAIDDAQWIDALSSRLVDWLVENATEQPLAFWFFGRPDRWATSLHLPHGSSMLTIGPLDPADASRLLMGTIGDAPPSVLERAGGNPLFLKELARLHAQRGGELSDGEGVSVVDLVFGARLARLEPSKREFVKRAAVLGRVGWVEAVQSMAGDAGAWRRLLAEKVFQRHPRSSIEGAQEFAFSSGLMTEVAYRLWPAWSLPTQHEAAARWLEARTDASPSEVGRHWESAQRREEAASAFARAAEAAARAGDSELALEMVRRVMRLSSEPSLRWRSLAAQDAVFQLYANKEQQELQEQGLDLMRRLSLDLSLRHTVETAWRQCYFYRITGNRDLTVAFGEEAIALASAIEDAIEGHRWASAAHNELALLHADAGAFDEALLHAKEAHLHASQTEDPWWLARTCFSEAYVIIEMDRLEEALSLFDSAADGYARGGDRRREAIARMNRGFALMRLGRLEEAEASFDDAMTLSRKVGNRRTIAVTSQNRCTLLRMRGRFDEAAVALDAAERAADDLRFARLKAAVVLERTWLSLATRRPPSEVRRLVSAALAEAEAVGSPALVAQGRTARLLALANSGARDAVMEAEVRAQLAAGQFSPEGSAALAVGLHLLGGEPDDAVLARSHLHAFVDRAVREGDRAACVASFSLRHGFSVDAVTALLNG